jgi:hypothetical protein
MKVNAVVDSQFEISDSAFENMQIATQNLIDSAIKEAMSDLDVSLYGDEVHLHSDSLEGGAERVCSLIDLCKEQLQGDPDTYVSMLKFAKELIDLLSPKLENKQ